jgi:hypothetical protein
MVFCGENGPLKTISKKGNKPVKNIFEKVAKKVSNVNFLLVLGIFHQRKQPISDPLNYI